MTQTDRIDGLQASVAIKAPCRVATTAAITLAGFQTIDGVALAENDRVLVKDQTDAKENGIYVAASTAWSRAKDFNGARDAVQGTMVVVAAGTTHGGEFFKVTAGDIVFETTAITFESLGTSLVPPVPIGDGGTGATTADNALTNLGGTSVGKDLFKTADAAAARSTLDLGDSATKDVGTAAGTVADGTHTHSGLTDTVARANIVLNAFRVVVNGGLSVQNMVDGVVDEFEDETGVDGAASSNETYDVAGDYYHNEGSTTQVPQGTGTAIGNATAPSHGGLAAAFDGTTSQATAACAYTDQTDPGYVGKDWGNGNDRTIGRYRFWGSSDQGMVASADPTVTHTLQGSTDNFSASVVDLHSDSVTDAAGLAVDVSSGITTTTAYRYHRVKITATAGGTSRIYFAEVEFYQRNAPPDMTLQSAATTAEAQPDEAFIVVWQEDVDAVTLNTDLKAYASRDGGTTWAQATLAEEANLATGRVLTGSADISGQPAGTSMKWRVTTHNATALRLHGVGLEWR